MRAAQAPKLLSDYLGTRVCHIDVSGKVIAYPHDWQVPAETEKAAYESILTQADKLQFTYIGFPWATLIDSLMKDSAHKWHLVRKLAELCGRSSGAGSDKRVTVAQHISADRYALLFKACGITDLFWSHATIGREEIEGIRIHPFPLFPAQTSTGSEDFDIHRPRKYLANFIGAYTPGLYLSDVREHIFCDADKFDDLLIIKRKAWHFERAVYAEQINGNTPDNASLTLEQQQKDEYLQAIRDSVFTLCPTGSGPNSIRIWEALSLGSVPVILTRELSLPGDHELWEAACLFEDDCSQGYRRALGRVRRMSKDELHNRRSATRKLRVKVEPSSYGDLMKSMI